MRFKDFLLNDFLHISFFKNESVPLFDKICAGFVLSLVTLMLLFVFVGLVAVLFSEPIAFLIISFFVFVMISAMHLAFKYG